VLVSVSRSQALARQSTYTLTPTQIEQSSRTAPRVAPELIRQGEPTPLLQAPNLARILRREASDVLLKMDAETSFGLGGNKARKLAFELAPPRLEGATCVIICGGPQSNHFRLTAAAAARLGLPCILVVNGDIPDPPSGNAYLHKLFGAEIHPVNTREERDSAMAAVAAEVEASGGKAIVIPLGVSTPLGALGYVRAAGEIVDQ
jgi:1-aminocyclopropane-1-carboxylate deaminase/D-cysteine desulfhydrase-like pyridoxal-dependent ACC family enzyme